MSTEQQTRAWPVERLTRVPYWVYQDEAIYRQEQEKIFRGNTWSFLGLEAELPNAGDFKTNFLGDMPVVVTRDELRAARRAGCQRPCVGDRNGRRPHRVGRVTRD